MTTATKATTEFIAHVWNTTDGKIGERRPYATEAGAIRFAEKTAADPSVREVTVCQVGTTRKITVKRKSRKDATVVTKESTLSKKYAKPAPKKPRASTTRATQVETGPSLLRGEPGKVTTWKKALAYTDGALAAGYDARVQVLGEPKGLDLGSTDETAKFDASYLRFLRGDQKWVPTSAAQFGLDADQRKARRAAVRFAVAKAAKVEVVETANGPVPA